MGRCVVLEHLGSALYKIALKRDIERLEKRVEQLRDRRNLILGDLLPDARERRRQQLDKLRAQDDSVAQWSALTDRQRILIELQRAELAFQLTKIDVEVDTLNAELISVEAEIVRLEAVMSDPPATSAWCGDYTLVLQPGVDYGTMELPEAQRQVPGPISFEPDQSVQTPIMVYPGWDGQAIHDDARDGKMQPVAASGPPAYYFNHALLPGWQKWRPTYRIGTITRLVGDICDVSLDAVEVYPHRDSSVILDLNQTPALENVEIQYMNCNGRAFEVADRVVVRFTDQDWQQPIVIGFESNPKPCQYVFKAIFKEPIPDSDPIVETYNRYSLQYAPEPPLEEGEDPPDPPIPDWKAQQSNDLEFGTTYWRNFAGDIVLSYWGPPSHYWFETIPNGQPDDLRPGTIYWLYDDARLVTTTLASGEGEPPVYERQSLYQQTAIFRDGVLFVNAPETLYGCGVLDDSGGESSQKWLIAVCGKLRSLYGVDPDFDLFNSEQPLLGGNFDSYAGNQTYVYQTTVYATNYDNPQEWQLIGSYDYDDSLTTDIFFDGSPYASTRFARGAFNQKETNHQPWFFSPDGTKACSIKATEPFIGSAETGDGLTHRYDRRLVEITIIPPQPVEVEEGAPAETPTYSPPVAQFNKYPNPLSTIERTNPASAEWTASVDSELSSGTYTTNTGLLGSVSLTSSQSYYLAFDYSDDGELLALVRSETAVGSGNVVADFSDFEQAPFSGGRYTTVANTFTATETTQITHSDRLYIRTGGFVGDDQDIFNLSRQTDSDWLVTGDRSPTTEQYMTLSFAGSKNVNNDIGNNSGPLAADLRAGLVVMGYEYGAIDSGTLERRHWSLWDNGEWRWTIKPVSVNPPDVEEPTSNEIENVDMATPGGGTYDSSERPGELIDFYCDSNCLSAAYRFIPSDNYSLITILGGDRNNNDVNAPVQLIAQVGSGDMAQTLESGFFDDNYVLEITRLSSDNHFYFATALGEILVGTHTEFFSVEYHDSTYGKGFDQEALILLDYNNDFARVGL